MNFIRRAFIAIISKPGKTTLTLLLLFIIFTLVFAGFSIQEGALKSSDEARKKLGAEVNLAVDNKKMMESQSTNSDGMNLSGKPPAVSAKDIEAISKLKQVKSYQARVEGVAYKGKLKPASVTGTPFSGGKDGQENPSFSVNGISNLSDVPSFQSGDEKIISGKGITGKTTGNKVVIGKRLAEKNNLSVGDTLEILESKKKRKIKLKIIGIFESSRVPQAPFNSFEDAMPDNQLYMPYKTALPISFSGGVSNATFTLKDPKDINSFIKQASKLTTATTGEDGLFKFDAQDKAYKRMIGPIEQVASFSKIIVGIILGTGAAILALILMLSLRERKFEMGILLSIGENKSKLIAQFLVEILLIAIVSFGAASFAANSVGQNLSDYLVKNQVEKQAEQKNDEDSSDNTTLAFGNDPTNEKKVDDKPIEKMNISLSKDIFVSIGLLNFLLIVFATILPSLFILRLQPKMLFTKKD